MKPLIILSVLLFLGCSLKGRQMDGETSRTSASEMDRHQKVFPPPHKHGASCGCPTEVVDGVTYYVQSDGKKHWLHGGSHYDYK